MENFETIIGLEIHLAVKTKSKFFCSCPNQQVLSDKKPNFNICPICLGHPGVLPVINKEILVKALKLGLALKGEISEISFFDRKNYFYPDLSKGYQISQYKYPLIKGGKVDTDEGVIELERIHLEEDTAKLFHNQKASWLDFNRAGIPLLEIVTKPVLTKPKQAKSFLEELQKIVRELDISEAEMENGQMRCDVNISLRPLNEKKYYPKTEIKNLNSFKSIEKALIYEETRQLNLWQKNNPPLFQETRGWNEKEGITVKQREKEEEKDYRYFPEPDLPPLNKNFFIKQGIDFKEFYEDVLELPFYRRQRFKLEYGLNNEQAKLLADNNKISSYTEKVFSELRAWLLSLQTVEGSEQEIWEKNKSQFVKLVVKWLINYLLPLAKKEEKLEFKITPENFSEFIILFYEKKINGQFAKMILEEMFETEKDVDQVLINKKSIFLENKDEIYEIIQRVIKDNPEAVKKYHQGKINVFKFLIGQVMKKTQGKISIKIIEEIFKKELNQLIF